MALEYLTAECDEVKDLWACIEKTERALRTAEENHRPQIGGERYLTANEVCEYLHISPRTLQTLRDTRQIAFTWIGERSIIYPESGIREVLEQNSRPLRKP